MILSWIKLSRVKVFLTIPIVLLLAIQNNMAEYLVGREYPTSLILIVRGVVTLIMSSFLCFRNGYSLLPRNHNFQTLRMLNSGIAIFLGTASFTYLSAATVGVLQRLDIPLLSLMTHRSTGYKTSFKFWLSIFSIMIVAVFVVLSNQLDEPTIGFVLGISSVVLLSRGIVLLKREVSEENQYVLINTTCLGSIIVSAIMMPFSGVKVAVPNFLDLGIFLASGIVQYYLYVYTVAVYRVFTPDRARFPFVLGALASMLLEMWIEQKTFGVLHTGIMLTIMLLGVLIIYSKDRNGPSNRNKVVT